MAKGKPNKRNAPEFKAMMVVAMRKEGLSCRETARKYDVSSYHQVRTGTGSILLEGTEELAVERRGEPVPPTAKRRDA